MNLQHHAAHDDPASASTLIDILRWRAQHQPDIIAYTYLLDGETQTADLTYGALDSRAAQLAVWLQQHADLGARALLLYPPGLDYIVAFYACLYAGVVAVPAYPPTPAQLARGFSRVRAIAADAQPRLVLTTSTIRDQIAPHVAQYSELHASRWIATDETPESGAEAQLGSAVHGGTLAFLQYTSGSTAAPKGVMLTHDHLLHSSQLIAAAFDHSPASRGVIWLPPYHDMGLIGGIIQPLYAGFPVTLMSPIAFLQRPLRWLQAISRFRATTSGGPNFAYDLCLRRTTPEQRAQLDLASWRVAFNGAEPLQTTTLEQFTAAFAPAGFRATAFYPCYGLAEATLIVTGGAADAPPVVLHVDPEQLQQHQVVPVAADQRSRGVIGCGRALPSLQVVIVQPETQRVCDADEVGEIWVSGPVVAQGYWQQPDETSRTFNARIAGAADVSFLRTGDLGFLQADQLFVTGRLKDLIIIRGQNHYPQDIEQTVSGSHPFLRAHGCAAFSVSRDHEEQLVVLQEVERRYRQQPLDDVVGAIRRAVAEQHQLQVATVLLLPPGSVLKTSSGKIQRQACRAAFLDGSFEPLLEQSLTSDIEMDALLEPAPEPLERAEQHPLRVLRAEVSRLLRVPTSQIAPDQPLLELGLDSFAAVELQHVIATRFNLDLPITDLLGGASLDGLAHQLAAARHASPQRHPILPAPIAASAGPLSYGQQALWFLHQLAPDTAAYHLTSAAEIHGPLDHTRFVQAFQRLAERHAALRTTIVQVDDAPQQVIAAAPQMDISIDDGAGWSDQQIQDWMQASAALPFDLAQGPLMRIRLLQRSEQVHVLLLVVHHIIADLWSLAILTKELGWVYQAEQDAALPPLPLQFLDYVAWQRQMIASDDRHWRYWQQQLRGPLPTLNIPTDYPRPAVQSYRGAAETITLSSALTQQLRQLSRDRRTTLYTVLLTAFQILLQRHSGQHDLLIGSPAAARSRPELAGLLGYFVNPVVLRADLSGSPSYIQVLEQARQTVLDALDHQDFPFALLAERLQPERDPSRSPIFQAMFIWQQAPLLADEQLGSFSMGAAQSAMEIADLRFEPLLLEQRSAQFDLTLAVATAADGLQASLQYNSDLFAAATIQRMLDQLVTLLTAIAENPSQPLATLPLLGTSEYRLLQEWNATQLSYSHEQCIHHLFEQQAQRRPEACAVVFGQHRLSYAQLDQRANQLARHLHSLDVQPGQFVGIHLDRSPELIVALLAVLKAGAAYVPLDPAFPTERLLGMISDSRPAALITRRELHERLQLTTTRLVDIDADQTMLERQPTTTPASIVSSAYPAYVLYTSGSTGRPKGVIVAHRNVVNCFSGMDQVVGCGPDDTWLAMTSVSFDISVLELLWTLTCGAQVVLTSERGSLGERLQPETSAGGELDLSLFYFASAAGAPDPKYRLLLEGARFADEHGFSAVWTPERHFHAFGGLYPNPAVTGAALATVTQRLAIRAGSVVMPLNDPLRVAEDWAMIDNLSQGRVGIAFASGWHPDDFVLQPKHYAERKHVTATGLTTVQQLWRGERVRVANGVGTEIDVEIFPKPIQPELPTWITAAGNPDTFTYAGSIGANLLTHLLGQSLDELAANIERYRAARVAAGYERQGGTVTLMLHTFVGDDPATVDAIVRAPFTEYLRSSVDLLANLITRLSLPLDINQMSAQDMQDLLSFAYERYVSTSALIGTPEQCRQMLAQVRAVGVTEIACLIDFGIDTDLVLASLPRLAALKQRPPQADDAALALDQQARTTQPTLMQCTPSTMRMLLADSATIEALQSLRMLLLGGEALPVALVQQLHERLPHTTLINMYGPTETTIWSATQPLQRDTSVVPIGRPIANTQIYIVDAHGQQVPIGAVGELVIGGDGVAAGYLDRPALTAERFVPDPFGGAGARLYRTGDLARYRNDGSLEFLGRHDQQIKLRGYRIELGEIDAVLEQHPAVAAAVTVVREPQPGDQRLVSYLVPTTAAVLQPQLSPVEQARLLADRPHHTLPNGLLVANHGSLQTNIIYREVFEDDIYFRHGITLHDGACVFDVGANIGLFTLLVHQRYRQISSYVFEPIPPTFDLLQTNLALYGVEAHAFALGLAQRQEEAEFIFYAQAAGLSSRRSSVAEEKVTTAAILRSWMEERTPNADDSAATQAELDALMDQAFQSERYVCPVTTLSAILREQQISHVDLLKIDVEKSELDVIEGIAAEDWAMIDQIVIEVHAADMCEQIRDLLAAQGYLVDVDESITVEAEREFVYMLYARRPELAGAAPTAGSTTSAPPLTIAAIHEHARQHLPDYMIPNHFAILTALPLTANGKLDRAALPPIELEPEALPSEYIAPQSKLEQVIADIWQRALGIEHISVQRNFFDLGGHSLLMAQVHSQLQEALGRSLSLIKLLEHPTISSLAKYLSRIYDESELFEQSTDRARQQRDSLRKRQQRARRGASGTPTEQGGS